MSHSMFKSCPQLSWPHEHHVKSCRETAELGGTEMHDEFGITGPYATIGAPGKVLLVYDKENLVDLMFNLIHCYSIHSKYTYIPQKGAKGSFICKLHIFT